MLVTYFVNFRELNDHLFGKELFIRFSASAFRKLPPVYVFSYFPFGFEGRMWDLIVSVPDHCLSFYLLPWLFTLVQRNYARWLPVHIREMASVHETHPDNYVQPSCKPKKCKRLSRKMWQLWLAWLMIWVTFHGGEWRFASSFQQPNASWGDKVEISAGNTKGWMLIFLQIVHRCLVRESNIGAFFRHENRPYPPALSGRKEIRHRTKSDQMLSTHLWLTLW